MANKTPNKLKQATEAQEQGAVITWFESYARTSGINPLCLISIPNGAYLAGDIRSRSIQMAKLKKTGLRPGVPDLFLAIPKMIYNYPREMHFAGLFMEMKRKGAPKPKQEQWDYHILLRKNGYNVLVCFGADEAIRAIKAYLS